MKRAAWLLLLLMLTIGTVGCRAQPQPIPPLIGAIEAERLGYLTRWTTDLAVPRNTRLQSVTLVDDLLISVEAPTNLLTALSLKDGSVVWRRQLYRATDRLFEPFRYGNDLIINSERQLFHLSWETGELLRFEELESAVAHRPAIVDIYAVFGGSNGNIFGHDLIAGYTRWAYQMTAPVAARPVVTGDNVFAADTNGTYALLRGSNGELIWKSRALGRISVNPAATSQVIYLASEDHNLYAINRATGRDRWVFRSTLPLTLPPEVIGNTLFLPLPQRGVVALDAASGTELWRLPVILDPLLIDEQRVLVSAKRSLMWLDLPSGKTLREAPVEPLKTVIVGSGNSLVLVTDRGRLVRLDPQQ